MRRNKDAPEVGFTARITKNQRDGIVRLFPMTGGKRWLMETALEEFIQCCEKSPALVSEVNDKIMQMAEDGRPTEKLVEFLPRVKTDLYSRFNDLFPQKGATTWFIRSVVAALIQDAIGKESLEERVRDVVRALVLNID